MKKEVSPLIAIVVVAVLLTVIVVVFWRSSQPREVTQPRVTAPPFQVVE